MGIFWLELGGMYFSNALIFNLSSHIQSFAALVLCLVFAMCVVYFFKNRLQENKELKQTKQAYNKFKYNFSTLETVQTKQKDFTMPNFTPIRLKGDSNSANNIMLVCSSRCMPCVGAHKGIHDVLHGAYDDVSIDMIFTVSPSKDTTSDIYKVPKHIVSLYENSGREAAIEAIDDWYNGAKFPNFDDWTKKFPLQKEAGDELLKNFETWCNDVDIQFTPTIIFNGRQLSEHYTVADLKYFVD